MRIIAGALGGRRIASPPGRGTRPMLDRVREALFSTLGPGIEGARVLDLFAGTGSLGLEALSRGAERALLVERDPRVVRLLGDNVRELGLEDRALVRSGDALDPRIWNGLDEAPLVCFLDPPYPFLDDERRERVFAAIETLRTEVLAPGGRIVFHAPKRKVDAPHFPAGCVAHERVYGNTSLWYVEAADDAAEESAAEEGAAERGDDADRAPGEEHA